MTKQTEEKKALVLGATGGIGGETARRLRDAGWQVTALRRNGAAGAGSDGILWRQGDALRAADVREAAAGCSAIVHAVNPPGYRNWSSLVLPMLDNTIAAAESAGATVVLPGNVYNYGPDVFPLIGEDAPQNASTRKGAIRVEMERRLRRFSDRGGQAVIVRAGDFFGPAPGNGWFSQGVVTPGKQVRRVAIPGRGVGHQWAYLPDVARTIVAVLERRDRIDRFASFHMAGHWDADGMTMADAVCRVVERHGGKAPKVVNFPWWLLTAASPFVTTFREMQEMRYLWQRPVRMDNARLIALLGSEPHTPLEQAVEATLKGLGCLA